MIWLLDEEDWFSIANIYKLTFNGSNSIEAKSRVLASEIPSHLGTIYCPLNTYRHHKQANRCNSVVKKVGSLSAM